MVKAPAKKPTGKAVAVRKKKTPAKPRVNQKQERFIQEYLIDLNATQAAIRAGYSERSAYSTGHRMLNNAEVAARLTEARQEWAERVGITQDAVLNELAALGFSRASDYVRITKGGEIEVSLADATDRQMAAIKSIETSTEIYNSKENGDGGKEVTRTKLTLHDKRLPLRDIGQHLGMFKEDAAPQGVVINVKEIKLIGVLPSGQIDDSDEILQEV